MYTPKENEQRNLFDDNFKRFEEILIDICEDHKLRPKYESHKSRAIAIRNSRTSYSRVMNQLWDEVELVRDIRNSKAHERLLMYPAEQGIAIMQKIIDRFDSPPPIKEIDLNTIYTMTFESKLYDALKVMREKLYTHIPVLKEGKYMYTLSESLLTKRLYDQIDPGDFTTCFESVTLKDLNMEDENEEYMFMSQSDSVDDVLFAFESHIHT